MNLGSAQTDRDGLFTVEVPLLHHDPFFEKYTAYGENTFDFAVTEPGVRFPPWDLQPSSVAVKDCTAEMNTFALVRTARFSGSISAEFWRTHGLPETIRDPETDIALVSLCVQKDFGTAWRVRYLQIRADRTFSRELPPGTYEFSLRHSAEKIVLEDALKLKEGEETVYVVKQNETVHSLGTRKKGFPQVLQLK